MWFSCADVYSIRTPQLAFFPKRIEQNIAVVKRVVNEKTHRLCPHIKTHKSTNVLQLFVDAGITQFKSATIEELQLTVGNQATTFALYAKQPVGPALDDVVRIAGDARACIVATIIDNEFSFRELESSAEDRGVELDVLIDINNGMNRTGIRVSNDRSSDVAFELYRRLSESSVLGAGGLHVYDGHIHDTDLAQRQLNVEAAMESVLAFRDRLEQAGFQVPRLVTGGTPSFPIHAQHQDRICSPGTPALWDAGYAANYPDLPFCPAAVLFSRVISKLADDTYCLDLGYKSVASEMPPPRLSFLDVEVVEEVAHSEEHLVIRVAPDQRLAVGQIVTAIPWHICPTVARHAEIIVVDNEHIVDRWKVSRDRVGPQILG